MMNEDLIIPPGTTYEHMQAKLLHRDGWMCEKHPGHEWGGCPGGKDCPGPGMPWMIIGRETIEQFKGARLIVTGNAEMGTNMVEFSNVEQLQKEE